MKLITLLAGILLSATPALAETQAFFATENKAVLLIQDKLSGDADFFWSVLAVTPIVTGSRESKTFKTRSGKLKITCSRTTNPPQPVTSCTLNFAVASEGDGDSDVVKLSRGEGRIDGIFSDEVAAVFRLPQELVKSPDGKLTLCTACGMPGAGLSFSLTWQR